jgi:hypothetical protein
MSKKTSGSKPKNSRPITAEPTPPLLGDKLIAQLQGAVSAAQRKRVGESRQVTNPLTLQLIISAPPAEAPHVQSTRSEADPPDRPIRAENSVSARVP